MKGDKAILSLLALVSVLLLAAGCGGDSKKKSTAGGPKENFYFFGNDNVTGWELWKTDGTEAGTSLVKDINPGAGSSEEAMYEFNQVGNTLFFRAYEATNWNEPWISDGTEAGTQMLMDINPGPVSSSINTPVPYNGGFIFEA
ncbi:MAG: hypothetical protein OEZ59_00720, partial [Deltaproteobacteria bacterium]|nr:hypothetical protein [Deltaproteobacteria bacterium]